jgi:hypothetical protein
LIYASFVFSFSLLHIRQTNSEQLLNSLCKFNLDFANEYNLNVKCTILFGLISLFVPLKEYITNSYRDLFISTLTIVAFYILKMLILNSFSLSKLFISLYRNRILTYYSGAFSITCNKCTLDNSSLKFTCTCIDYIRQDSVFMLNLSKYITFNSFYKTFLYNANNI